MGQWVYEEKIPMMERALVVEVGTPVMFAVETNEQGFPQAKDISVLQKLGKGGKGKFKAAKSTCGKGKGKGKDGKGKDGKGKAKGGSKAEDEGAADKDADVAAEVGDKK